jgi:dCMP deaminase
MTNWDNRFLALAEFYASWSKDPSTKVGAVVVRPDKTVASYGFNGFPRGVLDLPERYADRAEKYPRVVHAEANAIYNAHERLDGYTLYVSPLPPCNVCAGAIIQSGITRVVAYKVSVPTQWQSNCLLAVEMFHEAGVAYSVLDRV